jgi:uncharacterized protein involved in exopolysaccharide biosynthesis
MSILQFLRIFWARRTVVITATVCCLIGALVVVLIITPVWKASSRVMVDQGKTDVVTGEADPNSARGAVETQLAMATDYTVAGRVIDDLNLTSDPGLIAGYEKRSKSDVRDFRHWLEQLIIDGAKAKLLEDSAIIEITYSSSNPEQAKKIADAIRDAFIQTNLDMRRKSAEGNADWLESRSIEAKNDLDKAVATETDFERANGLAMAADKADVDTARLQAMSAEGAQGTVPPPAMLSSSQAAIELASVDAQIAAQSKQLGPNNPLILQLRSQKTNLEATVAKEQATQKMLAGIAASNSEVLARQIAAQKAKVVGESDKIGKLKQLQAEVDLRRDVFDKTTALAVQQREQALTINAGLTPLGSASVPKDPAFPNPWLIFPGALALGLAFGVLTSLLMELLARRVRGVEDLSAGIDVPVLGLIAGPPRARRGFALRSRPRFALPRGGKAAHA